MAAKVNKLEERKQQLLARSDVCRRSIDAELRHIKTATAWVPKTIGIARTAYPAFLLAAPLLGYLFGRKRRLPLSLNAPARRGMAATAFAGYKLFRKVKPYWDRFRSRQS